MSYNSFDEILNAVTLNNAARVVYTRKWLEENYQIKNPNAEWLSLFSDVHNHDNMPKHFGDTHMGTAFMKMDLILTKVGSTWHIGVSRKGDGRGELLHPKSEGASYTDAGNQKLRVALSSILKNGSLKQNTNSTVSTKQANLSDSIYHKEDEADRASSDFSPSAPVDNLNVKTKSVDIDMSAYL